MYDDPSSINAKMAALTQFSVQVTISIEELSTHLNKMPTKIKLTIVNRRV